MASKLPKSVKINYRNYEIHKSTNIDQINHGSYYGMLKNAEGIILISEVHPHEDANTLLHEMLHVVWRHYDLDKDIEEHYVTVLANGLSTVIRDNPKVFEAIKDMLHENG